MKDMEDCPRTNFPTLETYDDEVKKQAFIACFYIISMLERGRNTQTSLATRRQPTKKTQYFD